MVYVYVRVRTWRSSGGGERESGARGAKGEGGGGAASEGASGVRGEGGEAKEGE